MVVESYLRAAANPMFVTPIFEPVHDAGGEAVDFIFDVMPGMEGMEVRSMVSAVDLTGLDLRVLDGALMWVISE